MRYFKRLHHHMGYDGKTLDDLRHDGAKRRRLNAIREELYKRDLRRWSISFAVIGGLLAIPLSIFTGLFPLYAIYGAFAGWLISQRDLHVFGGLCCYGGGHVLLSSMALSVGLQAPGFAMSLSWLTFLVVGGGMGLFVQMREWRIERALALLEKDGDIIVHDGEATTEPRESPNPELDPELKRPGYVLPNITDDIEAIPFGEQSAEDRDASDQTRMTDITPVIITNDEDFKPAG